jgi:hypothetical protein
VSAFRRLYGDSPLQFLVLAATTVVAGYAATRVVGLPGALRIAVWFLGAAVVWDLVVGPLLALADRGLRALLGRGPARPRGLSALNHVRMAVLLAGLLLVVFASLVFQRAEPAYTVASGLTADPYLERWLLVAGLLAAGALASYAVTRRRASRRTHG